MTTKEIKFLTNTYGLVVCGGKSSRMGSDKSLLQYFEKPQRYHVFDMLVPFCEKVLISCNSDQAKCIEPGYDFIADDTAFADVGPMAALLSAFTKFPEKNIMLIGCDYPFLAAAECQHFITLCTTQPVSFYNESENVYEPLLAWYPATSSIKLKEMFNAKQFSLQHFLKDNRSVKYYPSNTTCITSVDTEDDYRNAINILKA